MDVSEREVSEGEAHEQIERLIRSELFRFSELQRRLLVYLADKSLRGEADQLKEYTIAIDALGKAESYDPRRDSAVRLQSGKLRQKIREYYSTAGQFDPVLVDFPKGHFKLVFGHREITPAAPEPVAIVAEASFKIPWVWAAVAMLLAGLCIYLGSALWRANRERQVPLEVSAWPPAVDEFWSPFLESKDQTLICVGTPLFVKLPDSGFFRDSEVNSWDRPESLAFKQELRRLFPRETAEPWFFFTGIGEAAGAFQIGNLLTARGFRLNFTDSSQVTWNQIGEHDVVFVGPPKFVPQIEDLPVTRDLIIDATGIRNLKPKPGEPEFLKDSFTDSRNHDSQSYGLISRLPGLHGRGQILVVGGTWTVGTLAAAQYVTLENHLRELVGHVQLPSGKMPAYFQVVVSATVKRGTPVEVTYAFHHTLQATRNSSASTTN